MIKPKRLNGYSISYSSYAELTLVSFLREALFLQNRGRLEKLIIASIALAESPKRDSA